MVEQKFITTLLDGTIKQINPFTGDVVWFVPGRDMHSSRSFVETNTKKKIKAKRECDFCFNRMLFATPEISRISSISNNKYKIEENLLAEELFNSKPLFRCIPNLFPAFPYEYWKTNYSFNLNSKNQQRLEHYISTNGGLKHVNDILTYRSKNIATKNNHTDSIEDRAKFFFGGSHDLVIAGPHYIEDKDNDFKLFCSATMSINEHFEYLKFTTKNVKRLYDSNSGIKYISVFQNWLNESGASLEHLHKQLVGIDEYGPVINNLIVGENKTKGFVARRISDILSENNLIIAQKGQSLLYVDIGCHFPTITVCFTGKEVLPWDISEKDLKDISDLLWISYRIFGQDVSLNEEWTYAPPKSDASFPFRIQLKRRFFRAGGFEGGTEIHINQVNPFEYRDFMVKEIHKFVNTNVINNIKIGDDVNFKKEIFATFL